VSDDHRARDLGVQNARLLADLDRSGRLNPCEGCGMPPTIEVDPHSSLGRPLILHRHKPWCPWHDDYALTAEVEVEPVRVALDWLAWKAHKRRDDE